MNEWNILSTIFQDLLYSTLLCSYLPYRPHAHASKDPSPCVKWDKIFFPCCWCCRLIFVRTCVSPIAIRINNNKYWRWTKYGYTILILHLNKIIFLYWFWIIETFLFEVKLIIIVYLWCVLCALCLYDLCLRVDRPRSLALLTAKLMLMSNWLPLFRLIYCSFMISNAFSNEYQHPIHSFPWVSIGIPC